MKTEYPKLPPKFKAKWLTALRGGEYVQGLGGLLEDDMYCCLGVACRVARVSKIQLLNRGFPSKSIKGIPKYLTFTGKNIPWQEVVSDMNDGNTVRRSSSFKQIANWIDNNL